MIKEQAMKVPVALRNEIRLLSKQVAWLVFGISTREKNSEMYALKEELAYKVIKELNAAGWEYELKSFIRPNGDRNWTFYLFRGDDSYCPHEDSLFRAESAPTFPVAVCRGVVAVLSTRPLRSPKEQESSKTS
jgi:hypothetical protein